MARVLFVHGMGMQKWVERGAPALLSYWRSHLDQALTAAGAGVAPLGQEDVKLMFWADLFPDRAITGDAAKSMGLEMLKRGYFELLRKVTRLADRKAVFSEGGRPRSVVAKLVNRFVSQTALYMQNGAVDRPDAGVGDDGAYAQVQARFRKVLKEEKPQLVIGHSLGTVIAYEGLCGVGHNVDTFLTVGSPMATPQLILEPLKGRMKVKAGSAMTWPNVNSWINIFGTQDACLVPVKHLVPPFDKGIVEVAVDLGPSILRHPSRTHALPTYFGRGEVRKRLLEIMKTLPPPSVALRQR